MGFDRSKVKATSLETLQKRQREFEAQRPSNTKADFGDLDLGDNILRIYPAHPDENEERPFSQPKCVSYLTVKKQKRDADGKKVEGEFEVKRSPVFNSKVHGNYEIDLVEKYMDVAKQLAIPNFSKKKEIQDKIWSIFTYGGKGSESPKPSDNWAVYASKFKNGVWEDVKLYELKKAVTIRMNELAREFAGSPSTPDIYTDPDTGIPIVVTKTGEGKDTRYATELYKERNPDNRAQFINPSVALSDAQLERWSKLPSLAKKFVNSFTRKDLEYQIEGLERFDKYLETKGYAINVFGYSEFLDFVDQMLTEVPEVVEKEEEEQPVEEKKPIVAPTRRITSSPKPTPTKAVVAAEPDIVAEDADEEEEEEEEVKQPIVAPTIARRATVGTTAARVAQQPVPSVVAEKKQEEAPHIKTVNERLEKLKKKMGK